MHASYDRGWSYLQVISDRAFLDIRKVYFADETAANGDTSDFALLFILSQRHMQ